MTAVRIIVGYALHESLRRRVFPIVLVLTVAFLGLFALGARAAAAEIETSPQDPLLAPIDTTALAGATLLGLAMFGTLFLGAVLAVFLTLGVVRGDAERGLLQPLVVRPVGRSTLLLGRFLAAAVVAGVYVVVVFAAAAAITHRTVGWWPDRFALPALELAAAVVVVAALSLAGSVFLSATANGIGVFMVFGAGLVAGLLGQIGEALRSSTLTEVARATTWALPFEALYQDALSQLTADRFGLTEFVVQLGPFGGAEAGGPWLWPWSLAYLGLVGAAALAAFARRDL